MQPLQPALQDIINRLNQVNNILVTVKSSPSVDELSAALGLTMALNNYGKHATAVFSGQIPNAMSFLKPQKTFENNVHSLRDFIISLNKEKADKLRFAKDGEIVKIYITPYKSTITPTDLEYSEGDFNVEMVLAIGINNKEELDAVIAAHGRILHEATVATIVAGPVPSQLGSINWSDADLNSPSAMAVKLLQGLNNPALLSPEVSTALLTGIVAQTDRFSNVKTNPQIMEISAQLMSSGANHILVTSSIGGANPLAGATAAQSINQKVAEPQKDLVLELHNAAPSIPASNVAPMVSSPPPVAPASAPSQALADLLPKPVDTSQTVVPADLMPPAAATIPAADTTEPTPVAPVSAPAPAQALASSNGTNEILSEIDKIYSSQPFDPAGNPRQDVATEIILPTEENNQKTPPLEPDTSVQDLQAATPLKPIQATKDEAVDAGSVLGLEPIGTPIQPKTIAEVPGLEMPPEITPPPPPPNPLLDQKRASSIDTEPFGNTINFDPTKPAKDADQ